MSLGGALNIGKVGMGETTRPAGVTVDGNADINDVVEIPEQFVQVSIRSLVGNVANVQRSGRVRLADGPASASAGAGGNLGARFPDLDSDAAAVPEGLVALLNGVLGSLVLGKSNEAKTNEEVVVSITLLNAHVCGQRGIPSAPAGLVAADHDILDLAELAESFAQVVLASIPRHVADVDSVVLLGGGAVLLLACLSKLGGLVDNGLLILGPAHRLRKVPGHGRNGRSDRGSAGLHGQRAELQSRGVGGSQRGRAGGPEGCATNSMPAKMGG